MDDLFNSLSILSLVTKISYKTELNVDENNLKYEWIFYQGEWNHLSNGMWLFVIYEVVYSDLDKWKYKLKQKQKRTV